MNRAWFFPLLLIAIQIISGNRIYAQKTDSILQLKMEHALKIADKFPDSTVVLGNEMLKMIEEAKKEKLLLRRDWKRNSYFVLATGCFYLKKYDLSKMYLSSHFRSDIINCEQAFYYSLRGFIYAREKEMSLALNYLDSSNQAFIEFRCWRYPNSSGSEKIKWREKRVSDLYESAVREAANENKKEELMHLKFLMTEYQFTNHINQSNEKMFRKLLDYYRLNDNLKLREKCAVYLAKEYELKGPVDSAYLYFDSSLIYNTSGETYELAERCFDFSFFCSSGSVKQYQHSINYLVKAAKIFETIKNFERAAACYNNIAEIYSIHLDDQKKAKEYYKLGNAASKVKQDNLYLAKTELEEGNRYFSLKKYNEAILKYENALNHCKYFLESNDIADWFMAIDCDRLDWPFQNIGMCYYKLKKYDRALQVYNAGLELVEEPNDEIKYYYLMAETYSAQNDHLKELDNILTAIDLINDYYYEWLDDQLITEIFTHIRNLDEELLSKEGSKVAERCINLATACRQNNYPEKAVELLSVAEKIYSRELNFSKAGECHLLIVQIHSVLGNNKKVLEHLKWAKDYFKRGEDRAGEANSRLWEGMLYFSQGMYEDALKISLQVLDTHNELKKENKLSSVIPAPYREIGQCYQKLKRYEEALSAFNKGLEMAGYDPNLKLEYYNLISGLYNEINDYDNEYKYVELAFAHINDNYEELDEELISSSLTRSGFYHLKYNWTVKAIKYCSESLKIAKKRKDLYGQKKNCECLYKAHFQKGNFKNAYEYYERYHLLSDSLLSTDFKRSFSLMEMDKKETLLKMEQEKKEMQLNEELKRKEILFAAEKENERLKAESEKKEMALRLEKEKQQMAISAAVEKARLKLESENEKKKLELDAKMKSKQQQMEFEKQQNETRLENEKKELVMQKNIEKKELENQSQRKLTYAFVGGFSLMCILSFFIFRQFRDKQKANRIILAQKAEVEQQKNKVEKQKEEIEAKSHELSEKNREILDSISYARRLQEAILPPIKLVKNYLNESFILYRPKDIIAGDFYWMETVAAPGSGEKLILFAAADCTGHGVPGAMVSVVCSNALNRAVKEFLLTRPAEILDKVTELVIETFEKSENEVKDGMDISLCAFNTETLKLEWAGANNSLWIIEGKSHEAKAMRNEMVGNLENLSLMAHGSLPFAFKEIKADKQPIGRFDRKVPFTNHEIEVKKGDTLYLFTDGFADQFGGANGKKFKYKGLKALILQNIHLSMEEQKTALASAFENWKGSLEQVDDVCIIGVRV